MQGKIFDILPAATGRSVVSCS